MATWTAFYIKTNNLEAVINQLKILTTISSVNVGEYPADLGNNHLFNTGAKPTYLAIAQTTPDWIAVTHNSFDYLEDWSEILSAQFDTQVIVTMAQSAASVYYFALYEKGQKRREIEVCYSDDTEPKNVGDRFNFEKEQPGSKEEFAGEAAYYFGFEDIEAYCSYFGLEIQSDYDQYQWTIMGSKNKKNTVNHFDAEKPWWKFW